MMVMVYAFIFLADDVSMFFLFIAHIFCLFQYALCERKKGANKTQFQKRKYQMGFSIGLLVFIQFQVLHSGLCFNKYRFVFCFFFQMYFRGFPPTHIFIDLNFWSKSEEMFFYFILPI